ncbi:hypothetical protein ACP0IV_30980, partial [Pseudomonas aeruginosa]
ANDYRLKASRKRGFLLSGDRESLSSTHFEKRNPGQGGFDEGARTRVSDFSKVQAPDFIDEAMQVACTLLEISQVAW